MSHLASAASKAGLGKLRCQKIKQGDLKYMWKKRIFIDVEKAPMYNSYKYQYNMLAIFSFIKAIVSTTFDCYLIW